jgi:hypothetical protein
MVKRSMLKKSEFFSVQESVVLEIEKAWQSLQVYKRKKVFYN